MIKTTVTISNKLGLHARASAKLTKLAGSFRSEVFMSRNGRRVNAKTDRAVDSLLSDPSRLNAGITIADFDLDPFEVPNEELAEYLIASGTVSTVTETLNDEQVTDVLTLLGTHREGRFP